MYSGDRIDLRDLMNNKSMYDIDHIYPRSLTKDDSFNNLVLVRQDLNRSKSDEPISSEIVSRMGGFWHSLQIRGFISTEKYNRLCHSRLTKEQLEGFINRQLVETRQTTKVAAEFLQQIFANAGTEIVYVKAGLVSDFRYNDGTRDEAITKFYFPKVRDLNDFHHAKDAYLNIVVGNIYHTKFTEQFYLRIQNGEKRLYNLVKLYDEIITSTTGEVVWRPGQNGTIATVSKMMDRNNVLLAYETTNKSGGFFDQMIVKKGSGQYPIKTSNPALANLDQYGGFNKVSASHYAVVQHNEDKSIINTIVPIPAYLDNTDGDLSATVQYLRDEGYENPVILYNGIKPKQTIEIDGVGYRILSKSSQRLKCAPILQAAYSSDLTEKIKRLERRQVSTDDSNDSQLIEISNNLFDYLTLKLSESAYADYLALKNTGIKIASKRDNFFALDLMGKINVLSQIIKILAGSGEFVDLRGIGLAGKSALMLIPQNIPQGSKLSIIDSSLTGFFTKKSEVL